MVWTRIMSKLRSLLRGLRRKRNTVPATPDRETVEQYLGELALEMNLRLLCREETGSPSGRTLWVQEITVTDYRENRREKPDKKAKSRKERCYYGNRGTICGTADGSAHRRAADSGGRRQSEAGVFHG